VSSGICPLPGPGHPVDNDFYPRHDEAKSVRRVFGPFLSNRHSWIGNIRFFLARHSTAVL